MARLHPKYRKDASGRRVLQTFQAEFYDPHRHPAQKRVSLATRDKQAALLALAEMERDRRAGLYDPWNDAPRSEGLLLSEAAARFLNSREGRQPKTIASYDNILKLFRAAVPPALPLIAVESRHIESFLDGQDLNKEGRSTYMRHLAVFLRWCRSEGLIRHDPTPQRVRNTRREKKAVPEFLTEAQFEKLLRTIEADAVLKNRIRDGNRWLIDAVRFAAGTGMRRGEVCNLRWSAVDFETGMITVANSEDFQTKSGHERSVPLVGDARAVLERRASERTSEADSFVFAGSNGGQLNDEHLSKRFRYYRGEAKLSKEINFHSLRHTFASWWVLRGGDLYRLKEVLGHADIQTTMRYAHLRPDALREEMEKCFGHGLTTAPAPVKIRRRRLLRRKQAGV